MITLAHPLPLIIPKKNIKKTKINKKINASFEHSIELTGKMLGSFVLIYSSLNWLYYRDIRKKIEDYNKKNDKNK